MTTAAATALTPEELDKFRPELTAYCYRMLGSGSEAEDAAQDTIVRAWSKQDSFEGRSSIRSWLYRIATNICLDMMKSAQRRARPMELGPPSEPDMSNLGEWLPENMWISPVADERILPAHADPAEISEIRDSVRLAFVTALQHLPGKQRAALILCEVLRWQAAEAAELLDTTPAAINSALQRARATLSELSSDGPKPALVDEADPKLLARYVDAFQRYDMAELVSMLHADATQSMPPFPMWLKGAENIAAWMVQPGPDECRGSRLIATTANGCPAFAQYRCNRDRGGYHAWGLQILHITDGKIESLNIFLDVKSIFPTFGLPLALPK